jgi:hypothetical protein
MEGATLCAGTFKFKYQDEFKAQIEPIDGTESRNMQIDVRDAIVRMFLKLRNFIICIRSSSGDNLRFEFEMFCVGQVFWH